MQEKIGIIGGGSWGTALGNLLASNGYYATLYAMESEVVEGINNRNINEIFLPDILLHEKLKAKKFDDFSGEENLYVWAVPTQYSRNLGEKINRHLDNKSIVIATKGIEINTGELIIEILSEVLNSKLSIISGPSFAREVAEKKPTAVSIASFDKNEAEKWQHFLSNKYFRCYTSDDVIGVEVGGALKNVIAVATGICDGLNLGHNARAGIITRGLAEITRFGLALGGKLETFMGLSGMGDLVLTCTGDLSRNRTVGLKIGRGEKLSDVLKDMKMVAEGVYTVKAVYNLAAKIDIEMPITNEVYEILYNDKDPLQSLTDLMNRPLKKEHT
jgi:glycerol-3-phosphate dehydrogenase (NAD(P)+)